MYDIVESIVGKMPFCCLAHLVCFHGVKIDECDAFAYYLKTNGKLKGGAFLGEISINQEPFVKNIEHSWIMIQLLTIDDIMNLDKVTIGGQRLFLNEGCTQCVYDFRRFL